MELQIANRQRQGRKSGFERTPANPKGIASQSPERATLGQPSKKQNPNGVSSLVTGWREAASPLGLLFFRLTPRVARSSQPWASLRNPVGIHRADALQNRICAPARQDGRNLELRF